MPPPTVSVRRVRRRRAYRLIAGRVGRGAGWEAESSSATLRVAETHQTRSAGPDAVGSVALTPASPSLVVAVRSRNQVTNVGILPSERARQCLGGGWHFAYQASGPPPTSVCQV